MLQRIYGTVWETAGRPGPLPVAAGGGQEARPPQARPRPRPVHLPSRVAGRPVLASARHGAVARARAVVARGAARGRLRRGPDPSLVRKELWETSGHWELYQDNMFVLDDHGHLSGLKPMNCPQEILIYKTRAHSYRELPMRFADYSVLFRKELTGALAGHVPRAAAGAGRLARLLPRRPGHRRDQPGAGPGAQAVRAVRLRAAASSWRRGRRSGWAPTSSGTWPRAS